MKTPWFLGLAVALTMAFAFRAAAGDAPTVRVPDGVEARPDLAYADTDNPRQRLDLYLPRTPRDNKAMPLIMFIHGGAWQGGDRASMLGSGQPTGLPLVLSMVAAGKFAGASVGYRLTGEAIWPAQIHDCKAAI